VYIRSPGDYFRILAIDDPPDDEAHGVWTVEPVDVDAAERRSGEPGGGAPKVPPPEELRTLPRGFAAAGTCYRVAARG